MYMRFSVDRRAQHAELPHSEHCSCLKNYQYYDPIFRHASAQDSQSSIHLKDAWK